VLVPLKRRAARPRSALCDSPDCARVYHQLYRSVRAELAAAAAAVAAANLELEGRADA
jgi:hypothetical protein